MLCYVFCICLLTTNKYQKYKSVELGINYISLVQFITITTITSCCINACQCKPVNNQSKYVQGGVGERSLRAIIEQVAFIVSFWFVISQTNKPLSHCWHHKINSFPLKITIITIVCITRRITLIMMVCITRRRRWQSDRCLWTRSTCEGLPVTSRP